jgi:hypothetical protein
MTVRSRRPTGTLLVLLVWLVAVQALSTQTRTPPTTSGQPPLPPTVEFNRDIRPILSDKCYACHGPGTQLGGLRFDREEVAKQALRNGHVAIVPGNAASSELLRRVTAEDPKVRMPQRGEPLAGREIALLRQWIEQGAQWQAHWSFIPPKTPALPAVTQRAWVRNPIDAFVLARLEREGLKPSPEADRPTWLRRVSLDLTGLPPTLAEIDAFVADSSPQAYEKVVDRLLASPRYGERMAFPWLEAARYADSNGYQSDGERHMWRWRDWVIDAFNANMPWDRFTTEQIAGDLLPNPSLEQRIATGFNRNHRGNSEGGIIPEEYAVEYVVDRVDTMSTVFLGLTGGCARCHNHKYDPITQKQYYQLFAYFNNIDENGKARRQGNSPPFIKAPTREQQPKLAAFDAELAAATKRFSATEAELARAQARWEKTLAGSHIAWGPSRGLVAHYTFDGTLDAAVATAPKGKTVAPLAARSTEAAFAEGRVGQALTLDGKGFVQGGDIRGFESHGYYDDKYSVTLWVYPTAATGALVTKAGDIAEPNGHGLNLKDGKVQYNYVSKWVDEGIRIQSERTLPLNEWHHVALTYDGTRYAEGVRLYVDGELWKWQVLLDDLNNPRPLRREPLRIGGGGGPANRFQGRMDDVRIYERELSAAEVGVLASPTPVDEIARKPAEARSAAERDKIRDYFLEHGAPPAIADVWKGLLAARAARDEYYESLPTVMVMEEMTPPRESHLLVRGNYDRPGEVVKPTLPDFLVPNPAAFPPNRLGLAKWLVDPSNPLMARVTVNRFWQMYFGTGIVKTVEDFGSQGDAPSHPELLDWLATEFQRTGWDVKALQKTIVLSATYRQASRAAPELQQRDPDNRLLARGPSVRLSADIIRDQALAIAGLLVNKIGGPSVKPYQPAGLWRELNSYEDYDQGHGDDLYRRSLYTFWKRSVPPPTLANFDASSREAHVVRQNVTNTPLQALDLMNNVSYVEAARVLAQRMMKEGGATVDARIDYAFRRATARLPTEAERQVLRRAFTRQLAHFTAAPDQARKYVSEGESPRDETLAVPELAAYTTVASLILNQSQTVMKS